MIFETSTTERMRIDTNGNIGIGTNNPSKKLDVTGDINFTGDLYKNGILQPSGNIATQGWSVNGGSDLNTSRAVGVHLGTITGTNLNGNEHSFIQMIASNDNGSWMDFKDTSSVGANPGWKKVFRQTASYLWTSGTESSPLENMKNNQLNTESDDNYSIMNEIANVNTRLNYTYNGSYRFKMINTQGHELEWTQTGNPFDYINAVPGTISNVSATNFTLSSGNNWDFDGLHTTSSSGSFNNSYYTILDGVIGGWIRCNIGSVARWSEIPSNKLVTISSDSQASIYSDWVELYVYVDPPDYSGRFGYGDGGNSDGFFFSTRDSTTTASKKLVIKNSGYVGINTEAPQSTLQVDGNFSI